ncbi:MAG: FkbM family methyltransferase [Candidatus Methylomirabilis sp.]
MKYSLKQFGIRQFPRIEDRVRREEAAEQLLVQLFFHNRSHGYFVEIGAGDPVQSSQTWHLEQKGWRGILVEPIRELCEHLRRNRARSIIVQAACGAPEQRGQVQFHISEAFSRSTLEKNDLSLDVSFTRTDSVDLKTLDDILEEIGPPNIDFVSIDVEGVQLNVLRGFNLKKYRPQLLLVEDHLYNLRTHRYLVQRDYRLVKRTALNSWYVPRGVPFTLSGLWERLRLWRKVWLGTPFRKVKISRTRRKRKRNSPCAA